VIERVDTNVLAFLNLSVLGMITPLVGELEDERQQSEACCST